MPSIAGGELAHDLGLLGIAEIHVVGDRERPGADRGQVAPGLGDRLLAALRRVGGAVAGRAVGGQRQRAGRGPRSGPRRRRRRRAGARSGRRSCCRTGSRPRRASTGRGSRSASAAPARCPTGSATVAERRGLRRRARSAGDRAAPARPAGRAGCRPRPGRRGVTTMRPVSVRWPITAKSSSHLLEDRARHVLPVRAQHHQHALLALRQHHLVGRHAGLALRHLVEVELDADAALARHLDAASWSARPRPCPGSPRSRRSPSARGRPRSAASR